MNILLSAIQLLHHTWFYVKTKPLNPLLLSGFQTLKFDDVREKQTIYVAFSVHEQDLLIDTLYV